MATLFERITTPAKVQKLQRVLYRKAKAEPGYRFYSLYGELLRRDVIETAMSAVAGNAGAAGVDGQECTAYTRSDEAWTQWRDSLLEELRTKTYRASPVRRVRIPKGDGKTRPLGIPTVKDRVVQTAVAILLLPIWEADSHPQSYAYRPKRNAQQAMDAISKALRSGRTEVIDADLSGYLDRSSYYTSGHGVDEKSCGCWSNACIRRPFCRPRDTWTTESSPRFTRCMIVCRDTPRMRIASGMAT